jgi:TfoX/Sxy family transcriptional regulator of competence genes
MAYDEGLAERVRDVLADRADVTEKKMFGGLAFMVRGNMSVGVNGEELMVRVGPEQHQAALTQPYARPMDFTGRPMKGYVFVGSEGLEGDEDLETWVKRAIMFALTLPPK